MKQQRKYRLGTVNNNYMVCVWVGGRGDSATGLGHANLIFRRGLNN